MDIERSYRTDEHPGKPKRRQIALCLSGGGYRAMLFHAGALLRLNEAGLLSRVARVSSVSGGSIAAGLLGLRWQLLGLDTPGSVSPNFTADYIEPLRSLAAKTIDLPAIIKSLFRIQPVGNYIAASYDRCLFSGASLQDLPDTPRFVFNATNMQSGVNMRFSKPYVWDYRVGKVVNPRLKVSLAVAASSAFPPVLSPVRPRFKSSDFAPGTGTDLQHPPFTSDVTLGDGGVYDNMGLETVKAFKTIFASNGGGSYSPAGRISDCWVSQMVRVYCIIDCQARGLRLRQLISDYISNVHDGAYWGISTDIDHYELANPLPCPYERTQELAKTPTRLRALPAELQEQLIDWGYAVCDAGIRKHYDSSLPAPDKFPYEIGVG